MTSVDQLSDEDVVALTLIGEAAILPVEGRIAIACCIRNRVQTKRWGSWRGVCLAKMQFSCWQPIGGEANHKRLLSYAESVAKGETRPLIAKLLAECRWIAQGVMTDAVQDTIKASTHYHTASMPVRPKWAQGQTPVCNVSGHLFYRGIR